MTVIGPHIDAVAVWAYFVIVTKVLLINFNEMRQSYPPVLTFKKKKKIQQNLIRQIEQAWPWLYEEFCLDEVSRNHASYYSGTNFSQIGHEMSIVEFNNCSSLIY